MSSSNAKNKQKDLWRHEEKQKDVDKEDSDTAVAYFSSEEGEENDDDSLFCLDCVPVGASAAQVGDSPIHSRFEEKCALCLFFSSSPTNPATTA